jgi:lambda repressor-like predicted transcriptional regulator
MERRYALQASGISIDDIADRVAHLLDMEPEAVWLPGKYRQQVTARSLLCFWAVRELGVSMTALGKRLGISTAAVSKAVRRGASIAKENEYTLC